MNHLQMRQHLNVKRWAVIFFDDFYKSANVTQRRSQVVLYRETEPFQL